MKKRLIGAVIVVGILLLGLILGNISFTIVISVLSLLGLKEIINIKYEKKDIDTVKIIAYICMLLILLNSYFNVINNRALYIFTILSLIIPMIIYNDKDRYNISDCFYLICSTLLISIAFENIICLRIESIYKCIYIFIISFITDTYAYIGGMLIGKKHFTDISPKKTIEGCITGIIMGTFIGSIFYHALNPEMMVFKVIIMSLFLTIISEIGDLIFSFIKRCFDKKDYSDLIPGHGGILDRFDSVIFVSLGMALIISIL